MSDRLAFNPTDTPVLIDDDGRSLAGGEWATVDDTAQPVLDAIDLGRLTWPAEPDTTTTTTKGRRGQNQEG
jgi:hypothetical protein